MSVDQPTRHITTSSFRPDVEGLRAVAIILVLLGHGTQQLVTGGFVGVDVFFVISGFLITGLLVRELDQTGSISLRAFYGRRARRLLPAAVVVLVATLVLTYLFLPRGRWSSTGWDAVFSALYAENWRLAAQSVDYLAADSAPSAMQQYWSLSVEEQFYLIWPLLLLGVGVLCRRRVRRGYLAVGLAVVALPSFVFSVWLTSTDSAQAYFVTTTRLWELAVGGFVALGLPWLSRWKKSLGTLLSWLGLLVILVAALTLSPSSPFPGTLALLPVLGAAAVIAGGAAAGRAGAVQLLGTRAMLWVGALSYSLYLWHWPLLVVAEARFGPLSNVVGLTIVVLAVVPAWLTFRYIENPIRFSRGLVQSPTKSLQLGAIATAIAVTAGLAFQLTVWPQPVSSSTAANAAVRDVSELAFTGKAASAGTASAQTPQGASALGTDPTQSPAGDVVASVSSIKPDPSVAAQDAPESNTRCHQNFQDPEIKSCQLGVATGGLKVAVAGDSHAAQWIPALQLLAREKNWSLRAYTKSSCPLIAGVVVRDGQPYSSCAQWNDAVFSDLTGPNRPDWLVVSESVYQMASTDGVPAGAQPYVSALRQKWSDLIAAGIQVVVLRDTPRQPVDIAECVSSNEDDLTKCAFSRDEVLADGGGPFQEQAAEGLSGIKVVDLNDYICPKAQCAPVIGGVLVYRDNNHITTTYMRTLAEPLGQRLELN